MAPPEYEGVEFALATGRRLAKFVRLTPVAIPTDAVFRLET